MERYYEFIRTGQKAAVEKWLGDLDKAYYNGTTGLTDENYDNLVKIFENRFGKREVIGPCP